MADRRGSCHVERARPAFIGVPYECRFCTRRGDWAGPVETPLYNPDRLAPIGVLRLRARPTRGPQRAPHLRAMGWRVAKEAGRKFFAVASLMMTSQSS